jgi:hypothetical protein
MTQTDNIQTIKSSLKIKLKTVQIDKLIAKILSLKVFVKVKIYLTNKPVRIITIKIIKRKRYNAQR